MGLTSYQKMKILTLSILLLIMALAGAQTHAATVSKAGLISRLQTWEEQVKSKTDLDPREHDLQVQFVQRLIFQTETKYREQNLKSFMQQVLTAMQETDDLGYFVEGLNDGLETLLEKNEDALSFMQAYLEFSSIDQPRDVSEFAETRSYYDGRTMVKAQTMELDEVAELLEKRDVAAREFKSDWTPKTENLVEQYKEIQIQQDVSEPELKMENESQPESTKTQEPEESKNFDPKAESLAL